MNKTPKLRFKEFSGDWESRKFGELIDKISGGGTPSRDNPDFYNGNIPWVTVKDLKDLKYINTASEFITELGLKNSSAKLAKQNDLIIPTRMAVGKILIAKGIIAINQDLKIVSLKENYNTEFMYYRYLNKSSYIEKLGVGSTVSGISMDDLNSLKFSIPKYKEQEKIASFFSLIDDKISLQGEKLEMLKDYKTGMMQKIFSRELRFKDDDGRDYPEWEEKKLGDIGFFKTSSVDKLINENEEFVYLVNYMDVYKHIDISKDNVTNLMQVSAKDAQIENNNLIKGDILFTPSSETPDDIGHSIVVFEDLPNTLYSYHLVRFRPSIKLNLLYSHYFCNIDSVRSQIVKFATGSTRFTVSINEFSQVKVNLPSYDEQKKIGVFLNNIDLKLRKEQEKLHSLNEHKKGLLQQMFV